jgi:acylphosphatase
MSERIARRLVVRGRVQGVWFRESMRLQAESLGVAGWVRNRLDGTVEALVEGTPAAVEAIVRWSRRGPEAAQVTSVDEFALAPEGFVRFDKHPTS